MGRGLNIRSVKVEFPSQSQSCIDPMSNRAHMPCADMSLWAGGGTDIDGNSLT